MTKLKGLGKGLDALLGNTNSPVTRESINADTIQHIAIDAIKPGKYQPRSVFADVELNELANSIRENGVIQPIILRKITASNHFELIAGERRWRATKLVGLSKIPAIIRNFDDKEALAVALIENIQRKDLNIVEEATGYKRLIDEFNLTHEQLAQITGKSRSNISNTLRLLNLSHEVLQMLLNNQITMGHARALLVLSPQLQLIIAQQIIEKSLTTSVVEKKVTELLNSKELSDNGVMRKTRVDSDVIGLEQQLSDKLSLMVQIKHKRNGGGKIIVNYSSINQIDSLLDKLK